MIRWEGKWREGKDIEGKGKLTLSEVASSFSSFPPSLEVEDFAVVAASDDLGPDTVGGLKAAIGALGGAAAASLSIMDEGVLAGSDFGAILGFEAALK